MSCGAHPVAHEIIFIFAKGQIITVHAIGLLKVISLRLHNVS